MEDITLSVPDEGRSFVAKPTEVITTGGTDPIIRSQLSSFLEKLGITFLKVNTQKEVQ